MCAVLPDGIQISENCGRVKIVIFVTGDTHIPIDIRKLNVGNFRKQKELNKNDFLIICGDFGGVWAGREKDKYWLDWLDQKNFSILFVDGNHENFHSLDEYPVEDFNGGKVHKINDSVFHLMRGQVFTIEGLKFFTMGGANSHDKAYRKEGISWWPEELPSVSEYEEAIRNLDTHDWSVDYVITHCTADSVQEEISSRYEHDQLTRFFEVRVKNDLRYKHWYFGHYHEDMPIDDKHTCMYHKIYRMN